MNVLVVRHFKQWNTKMSTLHMQFNCAIQTRKTNCTAREVDDGAQLVHQTIRTKQGDVFRQQPSSQKAWVVSENSGHVHTTRSDGRVTFPKLVHVLGGDDVATHVEVLQKLLVVLEPNLPTACPLAGGVQYHEPCKAFPRSGATLDLMDREGNRDHVGGKADPVGGLRLF